MNLNGRAARRDGPPGLPADKADSGVVRKKGVPTVKPARPGGQVPATSRPPEYAYDRVARAKHHDKVSQFLGVKAEDHLPLPSARRMAR